MELISKLLEASENSRDGLIFYEQFLSKSPGEFALIYIHGDSLLEEGPYFLQAIKTLYRLNLIPILMLNEASVTYIQTFFGGTSGFFPIQTMRTLEKSHVLKTISEKRVPVIFTDPNQTEFEAFLELKQLFQFQKILYLLPKPGLYSHSKRFDFINILQSDLTSFVSSESNFSLELLEKCKELFLKLNDSRFSLVFTSPEQILKELFTVKGAGTYIRNGSKILESSNASSLQDASFLFPLIESSFQKKLTKEFREKNFYRYFWEENKRGCIVLEKADALVILSKFAVDEIARGEGIARDLWDHLLETEPQFVWRAKPGNSINKWYTSLCDGVHKEKNWHIFWKGIPPNKIETSIQVLLSRPEDFLQK